MRLRHLSLRWLAAVFLLAALALTATPGKSQAAARPFETGISGIGDYNPLLFQRTYDAGARFIRLMADWEMIAPKSQPATWSPSDPADPHYNWSYLDTGIVEAVQAGLNPVILVDGAPEWAQRCQSPPGLQGAKICDPDPAQLGAFASAAARRYSGSFGGLPRVQYWQGMNEPNLTLFFFPQFDTAGKALSPGLYRNLINSFYAAVKAVDPSNLVIAAGLGPAEVKGYNVGPMRFTRELLCMKGTKNPKPIKGKCPGGVHFDIFDIHPYSSGGPTHEGRANDVQIGDLPKLQTLLQAADKAKRIRGAFKHTALWITEFGWDSNPPDPGGLPMSTLTQWTAESLHLAWEAGVTHFFWYTLRDEPFSPNLSDRVTVQSGLYLRGESIAADQPKEVLVSFQFPFVAFAGKDGLELWGRTPSSRGGKVGIQALQGGKWRSLGRVKAGSNGVFNALLKSSYGAGKRGKVRAVYGAATSVPFPMKRVGDFRHPPFG
jgi:hypothetical protein